MFRTPTLLNLTATGPYSHTGTYTLEEAGAHYFLPSDTFFNRFPGGSVCSVPQFSDHPDCATLYPNTVANSAAARNAVTQQRAIDASLTFPDLFFSPPSDAPPSVEP